MSVPAGSAPGLVDAGRWGLAVAGILVGQGLLLADAPLPAALAAWVGGLALFVWLQWPSGTDVADPEGRPRLALDRTRRRLLIASLVAAALVWRLTKGRPESDTYTEVTLAWLVSIGLAVAAAADSRPTVWGRQIPARLRAGIAEREWQAVAAVMVVASAARLISLERIPIVEGDGMSLTLLARQVVRGELTNPFTTGFYDNPTMYAFVQSVPLRAFGETLFAARVVSAIVGIATVLVTYLWCRRLHGRPTALIAAALLSVFHMHLHYSRVALNFVEDGLFLVLVLWLLDRALVERRRLDALLAGLALGAAQYFYFGSRLLIGLTFAMVGFFAWWWRRRPDRSGTTLDAVAGPVGWVLLGSALAALPLAAHYLDQPRDYNSRVNQVSYLAQLDRERERTGQSTVELLATQGGRAALLPFATEPVGGYHPRPPLVGLPMAVPVAIGLAVVTCSPWRRRHAPLALAWWASLAGVGLTLFIHTNRWNVALPLVAVLAAVGLDAVGRVLRHRLHAAERDVGILLTVTVLALMAWNLRFYFDDDNPLDVYLDTNTLVAFELTQTLRDEPPGTAVHTAFWPRMSYSSHSSVPYLADHVIGEELVDPLASATDVPDVDGDAFFAFLPERRSELDLVRRRHPGGIVEEIVAPDGSVLLVTYDLAGA